MLIIFHRFLPKDRSVTPPPLRGLLFILMQYDCVFLFNIQSPIKGLIKEINKNNWLPIWRGTIFLIFSLI